MTKHFISQYFQHGWKNACKRWLKVREATRKIKQCFKYYEKMFIRKLHPQTSYNVTYCEQQFLRITENIAFICVSYIYNIYYINIHIYNEIRFKICYMFLYTNWPMAKLKTFKVMSTERLKLWHKFVCFLIKLYQ